jgi:NAD(P)-dependent dehydrogenase (short-subunit alcohol dehydrogenase family)
VVGSTVERWGSLDVLFHCAVDVPFVNERDARLTELDDEVWERMLRLVLTGTFHCCKHAGRQMIAQGRGSIVLAATADALIGCAGLDSYTAAKGGVVAMTRSFAAGIARDGVRVNSICPSFVSSEPQRAWLADRGSRAAIESLHLLPVPTPEQIAPLAVYLASDESAAVTGAVIPIDSGYMAFKADVDVVGAMRATEEAAD